MKSFLLLIFIVFSYGPLSHAKVTPRMVVIGQSATVPADQRVTELVVIGGRVDIYGVAEKVVLVGGYIRVQPGARITEELKLFGGHLDEAEGSEVMAEVIRMGIPLSEKNWQAAWHEFTSSSIIKWFGSFWAQFSYFCFKMFLLLFFAALANHVAPDYQNEVYEYLTTYLPKSLFWGVFSILLVLPVTVFLALSIVGIPLLPLQFSLLCVFVALGNTHVARVIVDKLLAALSLDIKLGRWTSIIVGLILVDLFQWVPVVGGLTRLLILITGFGAASKIFYRMVFANKTTKVV